MKRACVLLALALPFTSACSTFALRSDNCPAYVPAPLKPEEVKIQYLGSGGYFVRRGEDAVLFGPVYSNPTGVELAANHTIRTDRALVDLLLPAEAKTKTDAIVIGHGHADHAMDTPYIATNPEYTAKPDVYASATVKNLIQSVVPKNRIFDVKQYLDRPDPQTRFAQIGDRMRLWPIRSKHSDQTRLTPKILFFGLGIDLPVHMWRGEVDTPMTRLPETASEWAEGEVYAYVLDFMDVTGKNVEFRVYYQDSGTDKLIGYPPDGTKVDVVLLCVGGDFERLDDHPGGIINATKPRFVVLGHWEDFFKPQTDICRIDKVVAIPHFKVNEFLGEAKEAIKANSKDKVEPRLKYDPILACPNASIFHFPVSGSDDQRVHNSIKNSPTTYDCSKIMPAGRKDR